MLPVVLEVEARALGGQVRVHHGVYQSVAPLLRGLHDSPASQNIINIRGRGCVHTPGEQRHGPHPPDIDIEICVDNAGVDAVHLHSLTLEQTGYGNSGSMKDVIPHLSVHEAGEVLGGQHLRHLGVAVRLLGGIEPAQAAPVIPVKPRA